MQNQSGQVKQVHNNSNLNENEFFHLSIRNQISSHHVILWLY